MDTFVFATMEWTRGHTLLCHPTPFGFFFHAFRAQIVRGNTHSFGIFRRNVPILPWRCNYSSFVPMWNSTAFGRRRAFRTSTTCDPSSRYTDTPISLHA